PLAGCALAAAAGLAGCDFSASKRMAGEETCRNARSYTGAPRPYHTIRIDGENDFNPETERFETGTAGYAAYLTWDECTLFVGYGGPALGDGECEDGSACPVHLQGASAYRYLVLYLDTGPRGGKGAGGAEEFGLQDWTLPFRANYLIAIRTDGSLVDPARGEAAMENVQVYQWTKIWSSTLRREWDAVGADMLTVRGNRRTGFVELGLDLSIVGSPCAVQTVGWIVDTEHHASFAYWPASAIPVPVFTIPRDSVRVAVFRSAADEAVPARDSARSDSVRRRPDPLRLLHRFGFELVDGVAPNDLANLDRISYRRVGDCAEGP
ncbi:MAG TPA: hypothetical protein VGR37_21765, partial [Longimicrobiaceae bacterium]|nr:hypothetical protein [Longimicrobiaceae bacterium]